MAKTILLVDDEKDIRDVLRLPLSDLGYEVLEAENRDDALGLFESAQPPMILTDIKMPGMDGIELLQKIKRENSEAEVILITGHGDMDLAVKSLKYGATDFITKPINVDVLEIALRRAAERILTREKLKEYTRNLERLVAEKSELQSHLSSLGLMLGSISHALKGLLTGLDAGVYMVNGGLSKGNTSQLHEGWEIVKQRIDQIRKVVLDILFFSKKRELKRERMNASTLSEMRAALGRLLCKLPSGLAEDPGAQKLAPLCDDREYTIARLINRRTTNSGNTKDYEFSRATVNEAWAAGLEDVRHSKAKIEWMQPMDLGPGVRVYDLPPAADVPGE